MTTGNELPFLTFAQPFSLNAIRSVVVIAPHPDDESLGCGGTIALLRKAGICVTVIIVSDGSMSHPCSKKYPADSLVSLREKEALKAVRILGVGTSCIRFMRLKDAAVPRCNEPGFAESVRRMREEIETVQPDTLFVPWRRDPHKDHRATAAIVKGALVDYPLPVRVLEYFVWLWARSQPKDLPLEEEAFIWNVYIDSVVNLKQEAIMAHVSQVTDLIDDDPGGFTLSPEILSHFRHPIEYFAEMKAGY